MKIKFLGVAVLISVIIFASYGIYKYTGLWDDVSNKVPSKIAISNDKQVYDPASIKGSSKFTELSEWFNIPLEDLGHAFNIPSDLLNNFSNKDLEVLYPNLHVEIGNASVKLFVALYSNIPYEVSEETYLPSQAVEVLIQKAKLSSEQLTYINEHKFDLPIVISTEAKLDKASMIEIKGKTTFNEVINMGIELSSIEALLGLKVADSNLIIKDFCVDHGLVFSEVKSILTETLQKNQ